MALLPPDVVLQLDEPVGHVVEPPAEPGDLRHRPDVHASIEPAFGDGVGRVGQFDDGADEGPRPD